MDEWTVQRILAWIEGYLAEHGDSNARISARWLVADALGVKPIDLYADLQRPLTEQERTCLRAYTARRAQGEPLQYITGTVDFRFVSLSIEPGVLIPRPETEVLVSEALEELMHAFPELKRLPADVAGPQPPIYLADICTGSGNIACSIASELPQAFVWATDIDAKAVNLARCNAENLDVSNRVVVQQGSLAEPLLNDHLASFHLVISNPPYIPSKELALLDPEVADYEPALALDGGEDGLDILRALLPQARQLLLEGGVLAVELHETCLDAAAELAREAGFSHVRIARDLANRPRILLAR